MARIRTIKPEFFTSEDITSLTPLARLFYVSLWCEADREGRLSWRKVTLKQRYLPTDSVSIETLADELESAGLIVIYEIDDKEYAEIPSFKNHQVINNREAESIIPPRVKVASARVQGEGRKEGREGKGKERKEGVDARGTRLPQNFEPDFQFAVDQGIQNTLEEANKFRDYWNSQPGQKGVKLDWPATWRNWCRNAKKAVSPNSETAYQKSMRERVAEFSPELAKQSPDYSKTFIQEVQDVIAITGY
jgi:hypothetical protein